ncbi:GAF domain-containing SpoIIE family protein phosphatase [Nocardia sp. NPDC050697]|uniref:PP2C family protein-serine/threonine phosphatase n=1 Tax=Nocardia sp. NPDC050697 TaxID=3155158 RepID=UPI0033C31A8D
MTDTALFTLPPEVEAARVRSLEQLHMAGTPPEERFARITRMARVVFGVPASSVNLIDGERQWFKQLDGLDLGAHNPREEAVCQATIVRAYTAPAEPALVLEDAAAIPEFAALPSIGGADGIRFYAGYPLYGPGGHAVGTFCLYDSVPRSLDDAQLAAFRELAGWAQRELESSDDLERAAIVQRRLLPPPLGDLPGYRVCATCLPAYAVGGDFYDHYRDDGGLIFTLADVMGKGLGAAILTAGVRSALRGASRAVRGVGAGPDLASVVDAVDAQLTDDLTSTDTFVTLFHARLELDTGAVRYVDAGHGLSVLTRAGGETTPLPGRGLPLGVVPGEHWSAGALRLEPGDTLTIASDGLLELLDPAGDAGTVAEFVRAHPEPGALCAAVRELAASCPPLDDATVLAIRREPE